MPVGVMEDINKEDIIHNSTKVEAIKAEILTGNSHQLAGSSTKLTQVDHHRDSHQDNMELRRDSTVCQRQEDTRHKDRHQCARHSRIPMHIVHCFSRLSRRRASRTCLPTQLSSTRSAPRHQERSSS